MILRALLAVIVSVFILAWFTLFTVDQREQAILFQLGVMKRADFKPGLHVMMPFINQVRKFDIRVLNYDTSPERFLTLEKKDLMVDSFIKWKIANVETYYRRTGGDNRRAEVLLAQKVNDSLRGEFGKRTVQEVVADARGDVMEAVTKAVKEHGQELGIQIVDVRIKRIDLPAEVSNSVYQRMRAERERVAREFRGRGGEAAERIRAAADRERTQLLAEAYREAEKIRGEGDAKATAVYAESFGKDADFFAFYRSLNAYKASFGSDKDVLVLEPDSEFFKFLKNSKGTSKSNGEGK
jgi:membrane protease subunit HflC